MNREEAKELLEMFRSSGADMDDPKFVEALAMLEKDPELDRQFQEQRQFDLRVTAALRSEIPVPADLRNAILGQRKPERPALWSDWRAPLAVAAGVAAIFIAVGVLLGERTPNFTEFRAQLVHEAWDGGVHLELESSDPGAIRSWLANQKVMSDFTLPAGLHDARLVGCRVVEVDGARVPMLCMAAGGRHFHLFVIDGVQMAQLPPDNVPDFEKCGSWKTASWRHGDVTYVLTGMKIQAFVSKFRKGGRWTMSG